MRFLLAQLQEPPPSPPPPQEGQLPMPLQPPAGPAPMSLQTQAPPEDIRDIVAPEPLPDYGQIFFLAALALAAALAVAAPIALAIRRRRLKALALPPPPDPRKEAVKELRQLERELHQLSPNEISLRISGIVKTYVHQRYEDPVLFETAEEFARRRNAESKLPPKRRAALNEFLERCETLKFSRFPEAASLTDPLLNTARDLVDEPC